MKTKNIEEKESNRFSKFHLSDLQERKGKNHKVDFFESEQSRSKPPSR